MFRSASQFCVFQSTPPVKAATSFPAKLRLSTIFQSTPPVKAATNAALSASMGIGISIHAAREGGDVAATCYDNAVPDFNPRRP